MADRDYNLPDVLDVYRKDGSLIKGKALVLVEEGMDKLYAILQDLTLPSSIRLEIMKYLTGVAGIETKPAQQLQAVGTGFSITINIPQTAPVQDVIDASYSVVEDDLPAPPQRFSVPNFDLSMNNDLSEGV